VLTGRGLKLFGIETFRRTSTRFQPVQSGPVDENYRLGSGDVLVLILTGDVEEVYTLNVTREGFIVIPQVGQVYVANLTMGQLEDQLYARLRRVYSGVRRGPNATTRFQISLARLRNIQVFVIGDVVRPGAYQISAAGTVLTALYSAGGPTSNGSFRRVEVRRSDSLVSTIDVYDYLLPGINASDVRLQNGDVVDGRAVSEDPVLDDERRADDAADQRVYRLDANVRGEEKELDRNELLGALAGPGADERGDPEAAPRRGASARSRRHRPGPGLLVHARRPRPGRQSGRWLGPARAADGAGLVRPLRAARGGGDQRGRLHRRLRRCRGARSHRQGLPQKPLDQGFVEASPSGVGSIPIA
jgi:protein involved in polysaccharide export with SLBB domain